VAAALDVKEGRIQDVRLALGGVAPKPWRARHAEAVLSGADPGLEIFRQAAEAELSGARGFRDNSFKIELAKRTITSVLSELANRGKN
jgi:xanthine dehydrogenase YagS FAD-binding subunit